MTGQVSYEPKDEGATFVIVPAAAVLATAQDSVSRVAHESSLAGVYRLPVPLFPTASMKGSRILDTAPKFGQIDN